MSAHVPYFCTMAIYCLNYREGNHSTLHSATLHKKKKILLILYLEGQNFKVVLIRDVFAK